MKKPCCDCIDQEQLYYVGVLIEDLRSDQAPARIGAMRRLGEIGNIE